MKKYFISLIWISIIFSCKESTTSKTSKSSTEESTTFFPVTSYIKGQINEIKERGINPIKIITINNLTDSTWLKAEALNTEFNPFLTPVIDTSNLIHFFSENKFLDQTINAYTFTYDPSNTLPDSISLTHWDVYMNPNTNSIERIYMVKKTKENKTLQLTWQSNKWSKILTLAEDKLGNSFVEKEEIIKWDF